MITPVRPLLARHIHISPSCWQGCGGGAWNRSLGYWRIYRLFEIIFEMRTVDWIGLQIRCSIQIHCFKKHSFRYGLRHRAARARMDDPRLATHVSNTGSGPTANLNMLTLPPSGIHSTQFVSWGLTGIPAPLWAHFPG